MRAADFAAWLLKDQPQWNRAAIDATIVAGQRHDISVTEKIPVAWIYLTAWITRDQIVQFRNDIYARDEQLLEATPRKRHSSTRRRPSPDGAYGAVGIRGRRLTSAGGSSDNGAASRPKAATDARYP